MKNTAQGTGDINLASAIAALGVAPAVGCPVKLISTEASDYVRFHMEATSDDGRFDTMELMAAWQGAAQFKRENEGHPFTLLMDFIVTRPDGCRSQTDWLEHAADFLEVGMDVVTASIKRAAEVCRKSPESPISYVVAFLCARAQFVATAQYARKHGHINHMIERGPSIATFSERLPKHQQKEILSRIQ